MGNERFFAKSPGGYEFATIILHKTHQSLFSPSYLFTLAPFVSNNI